MLQDGRNKRLMADLKSYVSKNCTLLTLRTVHTVIISGLADMICNTISIIVVPTLNTEEAKLRFYIPPKISKFPSNQLYLRTFQLLFFIHLLKRLIRQPRVSSVLKLVLLSSDASEPEIVFVDIQKHRQFPFGH